MGRERRNRGFTLLEMVVAIGIFAVIAAISYGALDSFMDARAHIGEQREKTRALQTTMALLERDLRYAVKRRVRDGFGDSQPVFAGGTDARQDGADRLVLTTAQPAAGDGIEHRLERVTWRLAGDELSRVTWPVLDRHLDTREYERTLLTDVQDFELEFFILDNNGEPQTAGEWRQTDSLPAGVAVIITLADRGTFRRVLQVGGTQ